MRITPGMLAGQVTRHLQDLLAALAQQQARLAAGRRVQVPSDDPGAAAQGVIVRSRQAAVAQFLKNAREARTLLGAADQVVGAVADTLVQARELAVRGASDTLDALARRALGQQVDQLLEALVGLANGRDPHGGYLFGGQESTRAPYEASRDTAGRITAVVPNPRGIEGPVLAEVSEGVTVATGVSGTLVFGAPAEATFAFDVLVRLRDALLSDSPDGSRAALDALAGALERATAAATEVGVRLGWLGLLEERLGSDALGLAGTLSRLEDLDLAQAVQELRQLEAVYEAALAAAGRILPLSLVQFLR